MNNLFEFEKKVAAFRSHLLAHPIYANLKDLMSLQIFMKHHVFAVWDFMSLLKSLQRHLTCVEIPWLPSLNPQTARFINEIVLAEETDEISPGQYLSHFELYLNAMDEVGADTRPILDLIRNVSANKIAFLTTTTIDQAGVWAFMRTTFYLSTRAPHEVAAAFLFGREDIIPAMFQKILDEMASAANGELAPTDTVHFRRYLERHIQVDGEEHGPLARKMLIELCGDDQAKWAAATEAALTSIAARIRLWDYVNQELASGHISAPANSSFFGREDHK